MTREEMIAKLLWNGGVSGFGICSVANSMLWELDRPGPNKLDWQSIVAVNGPPENYTDEELEKLVVFSEQATARYDKFFSYRRGANLIIFGKLNGCWLRKRMSWEIGPIFSPTLDEAIAVMAR